MKSNIWLIWLAVMWENLARNIADNWFKISVYNRTKEKTKDFIGKNYSKNLIWTYSIKEFVDSLESPKKIIIMVKAWTWVDQVINEIKPLLKKEDIIIDAWNSLYKDTNKRYIELSKENIFYIWCWVSGWEEWALKWPSIMPGWDKEAYDKISDILTKISAEDFNWKKCVTYIWKWWSWHYVKMIHNGIEYSIMQMIAESYDILRKWYRLSSYDIWHIFEKYNKWVLESYLIEITSKILKRKDEFNDWYLVDYIKDVAWAKWTGLWTSNEWLERWCPIQSIIEATQARNISKNIDLRNKLSLEYLLNSIPNSINVKNFSKLLEQTIYAWMIFSYAQWLHLIHTASKEEWWDINLSEVVRIWQWWCIIRAKILDFLTEVFKNNPNIENILELPEIKQEIMYSIQDYKTVLQTWLNHNIFTPALNSWLQYFFWIIDKNSSANLIQGMRDYFWAHTYERLDKEWIFHTKW